MLKEELSGGDKPTGNTWARVCDGRLRVGYPAASRHERVWGVCEACERAPAAFHCKADAASLCADCDAEVHSANPLARRHHRVPILPLSGYLYGAAATNPGSRSVAMVPMGETEDGFDEEDEEEAASWLLLNPSNNKGNTTTTINGCFLGGEVDEYLDLVDYNDPETDTCQFRGENYNQDNTQLSHHEHEYIVPVAIGEGKDVHDNRSFQMGLDYEVKSEFAYNNSLSTCHSVSVSSLDMGIVPDTSTSTISTPHSKPSKGTIDLFSSDPLKQTPTQLSPMDREAKVLRYRQKKKTRKFEKTIRYASRKAYAETRPRIKGRFAKRSKIEVEVDQMFSDTVMADLGYGIVPSF